MNLEIINIASETNNNKDLINYTHYSKLKNSLCGDQIKIKLIIENNRITDFGYQTNSCVYCQASANILSKISINSTKNKIKRLCDKAKLYFDDNVQIKEVKWKSLKKLFKKEHISRKDCILLPFKTLKKIVKD